jgi:predicted CoA-binding protein
VVFVAIFFPGRDFFDQRREAWNAAIKALVREDGEFGSLGVEVVMNRCPKIEYERLAILKA